MKLSSSIEQELISQPGLKDAMRHLTGGVCVITAGVAARRTGLTVTMATSLSTHPETMLIEVNRNSSTYPVIQEFGHFYHCSVKVVSPSRNH